jgi:hypothetical protein
MRRRLWRSFEHSLPELERPGAIAVANGTQIVRDDRCGVRKRSARSRSVKNGGDTAIAAAAAPRCSPLLLNL